MKNRISILMLLISILSQNCVSQNNLERENIGNFYYSDNYLHPEFKIFHGDDSTTRIYYSINFEELLYAKANDSSRYKANYRISYNLFDDYSAKSILDSASETYTDSMNYGLNTSAIGYFEAKTRKYRNYVMMIKLSDLNRGESVTKVVELNRIDSLNRQNFYFKAEDGLPLLNSFTSRNSKLKLIYNQLIDTVVYVKYFKSNQRPALPPNAADRPSHQVVKSDSSFVLKLENGVTDFVDFKKQGFYHFFLDPSSQDGITVFVHTSNYPFVSTSMQMIMPIRYITSKTEFEDIMESKDKKLAIDKFWLTISSSESEAKNSIWQYYNRVQLANQFFASEQEGWMTDRGMMFIVFGPPEAVYRAKGMETWVYGKSNKNLPQATFNFIHVSNPFTENDYSLIREKSYLNAWNIAVSLWRRD